MYLKPDEVKTHLYNGVVDEISRADNTILKSAIAAAIEEARGYLTAYDVNLIFNPANTGIEEDNDYLDDRNPILLLYVKDIAVWHYIQLSNPAVEMQLRLERYEKAISWLDKVQSGKINPNLPYPVVDPPAQADNYIKWGSNYKRNSNY